MFGPNDQTKIITQIIFYYIKHLVFSLIYLLWNSTVHNRYIGYTLDVNIEVALLLVTEVHCVKKIFQIKDYKNYFNL